jgi:hypothetical protein
MHFALVMVFSTIYYNKSHHGCNRMVVEFTTQSDINQWVNFEIHTNMQDFWDYYYN